MSTRINRACERSCCGDGGCCSGPLRKERIFPSDEKHSARPLLISRDRMAALVAGKRVVLAPRTVSDKGWAGNGSLGMVSEVRARNIVFSHALSVFYPS